MQTWVALPFADGVYEFRLGLAQIDELQNKTGIGIGGLYARVIKGRYLLDGASFGHPEQGDYRRTDIMEPIRQALIGGGKGVVDGEEVKVSAHRVNQLLEAYCFPNRPLKDDWALTTEILMATIEGYDPPKPDPVQVKKKEPVKRRKAGSTTPEPSPTSP